jgi:hypothetical protein
MVNSTVTNHSAVHGLGVSGYGERKRPSMNSTGRWDSRAVSLHQRCGPTWVCVPVSAASAYESGRKR